jgi:hypothetical protein
MLNNLVECTPAFAGVLLEELERCGFSNEAFRLLHHKANATIREHQTYCRQKVAFQKDGTNELVCRRLLLVRNAFKAGAFANPDVFIALAEAAVIEIPI